MTTIKVEGLREFVKELKTIQPELSKDLKTGNKKIASALVPIARGHARRDTGAMDASVRASGTQRSGVVRAGRAALPYVKVQHFGWAAHGISPNPFLYDALDDRREWVFREYNKLVEDIISRID